MARQDGLAKATATTLPITVQHTAPDEQPVTTLTGRHLAELRAALEAERNTKVTRLAIEAPKRSGWASWLKLEKWIKGFR